MPYVAPAPLTQAARLAAAESRWQQILALRPELQPAVALQRELIGIVAELTETLEQTRLPRLSLPPNYLAAKLRKGVPAVTAEPIPLPVAALKPTLFRICDALEQGGAGEVAQHIRTAFLETRLDVGSLLATSFNRDQAAIRTGAVHSGLSPDLLWLVAELTVSPFAFLLQRSLLERAQPGSALQEALDGWSLGWCPFCGSWPALAEADAHHRVLRCSFCALGWSVKRYACVGCGETGQTFVTAAPDAERKDRRLELCASCGVYLKAIDVSELSPFPLLAIADLETMDLDMAAMERGYTRPQLKEFKSKMESRR